jgi:hypothetical protein
MNRHSISMWIAFALMTAAAPAQSQQPYAGLEVRAIKALSEQQIADLRAGRGMSLALAAELNGIRARCMCSNWVIPWLCPMSNAQECRGCSRP